MIKKLTQMHHLHLSCCELVELACGLAQFFVPLVGIFATPKGNNFFP